MNFCPGGGELWRRAGAHPKTRYIAFTGSKEVGLHINQRAAEQQPGQIWIKRTILEMGGKDSIIVEADADFDAAVEGVAAAAFGFRDRNALPARAPSSTSASTTSSSSDCGRGWRRSRLAIRPRIRAWAPVVNEKSMKSILGYIEKGRPKAAD